MYIYSILLNLYEIKTKIYVMSYISQKKLNNLNIKLYNYKRNILNNI